MSRWLIVIMVVAVALVAGSAYWYVTAGVPVQASRVQRGEIQEYVDERGKTRLSHIYDITMPFAGRIEKIDRSEGDAVEAGQIVAQVAASDLTNEVAEAQAVVDRLQAAIDEKEDHSVERRALEQTEEIVKSVRDTAAAAKVQIASSKKQTDYDRAFLERTLELHRKNARTAEEVELAELKSVQSGVKYDQSLLVASSLQAILAATELLPKLIEEYITHKGLGRAVLEKQKAEAEARLQQILKRHERGAMKSPIDGVVLAKTVDDEQFVQAGTVLLRIGRPADLEVEADILSRDATRIREKAIASVYGLTTGSETDHSVGGSVHRVYPQAFTKISSLGVEQQRVKVIVRLAASELQQLRELGVGADYRVRVRIFTDRHTDALLVPRSAMFRGAGGGWQVFAVANGTARLRDVTIGLMNDQHVEIIDGLEQDELVILAPENDLVDGIRVKATTK